MDKEKMNKEVKLVNNLTKKRYTISVAESCTGGLLSSAIVNVSGASDVYRFGYVTYSNEAKEQLVHVNHETLERYGAVSGQTASEMALGCARASGADVALSTTGIAGPGGGTPEKPVGLVYISCCLHGNLTTRRFLFSGDRSEVRRQAVEAALDLADECLNMM